MSKSGTHTRRYIYLSISSYSAKFVVCPVKIDLKILIAKTLKPVAIDKKKVLESHTKFCSHDFHDKYFN